MSGKWLCEQDEEDFEQDKAIKNWIENNSQRGDVDFDYKFITSKGTPRNTLVRASISLDQQISDDGTGTFADLIKGSDGRDLYCGDSLDPNFILEAYLFYLNFDEETAEWLIKILKSSASQNIWRSEKFLTDSEW